ncbi:MAG TPA: FMN-binding negative transcriptional regulator [Acidobacteriaceae bacterium]|jgi:transcriptional regulator|nr:FMN-binding negative transcriptional regulator [Acidobacteriaceae bacterium]
MYIPEDFRADDVPTLHADMQRNSFAALVTLTSAGLVATHLPVLLDETRGPLGTILGHVSRANHQWQTSNPATEALLLFSGPDTYVTPNWYPAKQETHRVVPTWNYAAIHAYGAISFFDDPTRLREIVTRLTNLHESTFPTPWKVTDAPANYIDGQLKAIIGFELPITRIEGKHKFNQNRSAADQAGVVQGLRSLSDPVKSAVADFMQALTEKSKPE